LELGELEELGEIGKLLGVGEASWSWRSFLELGELGKLLGAGGDRGASWSWGAEEAS
jgi:hypothetical protein